jgi:hypothetical protein
MQSLRWVFAISSALGGCGAGTAEVRVTEPGDCRAAVELAPAASFASEEGAAPDVLAYFARPVPETEASTGGLLEQRGAAGEPVWLAYDDGRSCVGRTTGDVYRHVDDTGFTIVSDWNVVEGCPLAGEGHSVVAVPRRASSLEGCRAVPLRETSEAELAGLRTESLAPEGCRTQPCARVDRGLVAFDGERRFALLQSYRVEGVEALDCNDPRTSLGSEETRAWLRSSDGPRRTSLEHFASRPVLLADASGFALFTGVVDGTWRVFDLTEDRFRDERDARIGPSHPELHPESLQPPCGP